MMSDEGGRPAARKRFWQSRGFIYCLLGLFIIYSVVRSLVAAHTKFFWYDEVITWAVSAQGTWHKIAIALTHSSDSHPPLFYVIEHLAFQILPNQEVALRLPSIFAFPCTLVCVFVYVKRYSGEFLGLCSAVSLLATVLFQFYATDARAYSMVVACLAFALVCYQRLPSGFWAGAMAVSLVFAESLHHYAIFSVVPFGIAEVVHFVNKKEFRWRAWVALASPLVLFFYTWPFLVALKQYYGPHMWTQSAGSSSIPAIYGSLLSLGTPIGVALVCFLVVAMVHTHAKGRGKGASIRNGRLGTAGVALILGFLLLPPITLVTTKIVGGVLWDRYVLATLLGTAAAIGSIDYMPKGSGILVFALFAFCIVVHELLFWRTVSAFPLNQPIKIAESFLEQHGGTQLPIAVADGLFYLPLQHYAAPEFKNRLVYLVDERKAVEYTGTDTIDKNIVPLRTYLSLSAPDYSAFVKTHPQFLMYVEKPKPKFEWLSAYLASVSCSMDVVAEDTNQRLYLVKVQSCLP
jgi:hypothetical protein